jgi:hypothetical protein
MKKIILFGASACLIITTLSTTLSSCCKDVEKANLFIKKAQQLYDYYGNPMRNPYTGELVTVELPNALFYNERTGEYFNPDFGSQLPTMVGDVIQFASVVSNAFTELSDCENLKAAGASDTKMPLNFTFPDQTSQTFGIVGQTPPISPNYNAYGVGKFQIGGPGFISVNTIETDFNQSVKEFNEGDNVTIIGVQSDVVTEGRSAEKFLIKVDGQNMEKKGIIQIPLTEKPEDMAIFKNMNSESFFKLLARYQHEKPQQ